MLKKLLILMLALWSPPALANPEKGVALFMTHFIDQGIWDDAYRSVQWSNTRVHREALLERGVIIVDEERFREMIPEAATDEAVQRLKSRIETLIIESYDPNHLGSGLITATK